MNTLPTLKTSAIQDGIAKLEQNAIKVAAIALELDALPCTNPSEQAALNRALAPSSEAGVVLRGIEHARLAVTQPLDALKVEIMDYAKELAGPLQMAVESAKTRQADYVQAVKREQQEQAAAAAAQVALIASMGKEATEFWTGLYAKAEGHYLNSLPDLESAYTRFKGFKRKCPAQFASIEAEFTQVNNDQWSKLDRYFTDLILRAKNPSAPEPVAKAVEVTTSHLELEVATTAAPIVAIKGERTVWSATIPDLRKVDAMGLLTALVVNGKPSLADDVLALVRKHLPSQTDVVGVVWESRTEVTNRS
jgi:hypothetical protein